MKLLLIIFFLICLSGCCGPEAEVAYAEENMNIDTLSEHNFESFTDTNEIAELTNEDLPKITHREAIGIWVVPDDKSEFGRNSWMAFPLPGIFNYDGKYVTTSLPYFLIDEPTRFQPATWINEDGIYKLKTAWHDDSLFCVSPLNREDFIACFTDTSFFRTDVYEDTIFHTWVYEKVAKEDLPEKDGFILKKRTVFNYELTER